MRKVTDFLSDVSGLSRATGAFLDVCFDLEARKSSTKLYWIQNILYLSSRIWHCLPQLAAIIEIVRQRNFSRTRARGRNSRRATVRLPARTRLGRRSRGPRTGRGGPHAQPFHVAVHHILQHAAPLYASHLCAISALRPDLQTYPARAAHTTCRMQTRVVLPCSINALANAARASGRRTDVELAAAPWSVADAGHVQAEELVVSSGPASRVLRSARPIASTPFYARLLCYAMLCCAMLCYVMLCYAMLCYAGAY